VVQRQTAPRVFSQILQRDFGLALSYHQMHDDKTLEDNSPCGIAQSVCQRSEDLCDACFARMRSNEDMFDIFGFRGRELYICRISSLFASREDRGTDLDFRAALDRLLEGARHELGADGG
jgi:hypothetical protein